MFRLSRERREGPDVWLPLKLALFIGGAASAIVGMTVGPEWLLNVAIGLLALGVLLRFVRR